MEEEFNVIDNYFFIIQTIAERANDEFAIAIKQVCKDAMRYSQNIQKKLESEEGEKNDREKTGHNRR